MSDEKANKAVEEEAAPDAGQTAPDEGATAQAADDQAAPGQDEAGEPMPGVVEQVQAEVIAELEAERDALKDKLLRALAEAENTRRRAERDRRDAETYGGTRLARDLLAVHDNLDRALSHVDEALRAQAAGFIEGVELTQRELLNAFAKHKIEKVSPAMGEKFDPHLHQAMFEAPIPGATPGTVIEVMQAGFTIADRLLRPALVAIARAAPEPEAPAEDASEEGSGEEAGEDRSE
jgi:molecular chaperone GrpE